MLSNRRAVTRALGRLLLFVAALLAFDCQSARDEPTGGETHFLKRCREGSLDCGRDLVCACGACTLPCTEPTGCGQFPEASCAAPKSDSACGASTATYCEVTCSSIGDCAALSDQHICDAGVCRRGPLPAAECSTEAAIAANEVVILGDSFFAVDHATTAFLEDLARTSGSLSAGQRYRDYSSVVGNALALGDNGIANQYAAALAESPISVVIMTGGGADVLLGSCDVVGPDCPLLTAAADAASALFERFAADGVRHVVYVFYPDPTDPTLRAEVDALRSLLVTACDASPVACEWVDLRPVYDGHEASYLNAEGIVPTAAGAQASAAAIWSTLRARCIAQ